MNVNPVVPWEMQALPYGVFALYLALLATAFVLIARSPRLSSGSKLIYALLIVLVPLAGAVVSIIVATSKHQQRAVSRSEFLQKRIA